MRWRMVLRKTQVSRVTRADQNESIQKTMFSSLGRLEYFLVFRPVLTVGESESESGISLPLSLLPLRKDRKWSPTFTFF